MAYALIPDGYSLKKVTKLQEQAVNAKRRHDDVMILLGNPNTPIVAAGVVLIPSLIAVLLAVLKDVGVSITEDTVQKLVKLSPAYWLFKVAETGTEKGLEIGMDIRGFFGDLPKDFKFGGGGLA